MSAARIPDLYALEYSNAKHVGLTVTFWDESAVCGPEEDGSPTYFAEIVSEHPKGGPFPIFQGPARELRMWLAGYQWGALSTLRAEA